MATVTPKANPRQTGGEPPACGSAAPAFTLSEGDLSDAGLDAYAGNKTIVGIVPNLDTRVCAPSTKTFSAHVRQHADTALAPVSADPPSAMSRFCGGAGLDDVGTLSTMRSKRVAEDDGVLLTDGPPAGPSARAALVLDVDNRVPHSEPVDEIADEPDYRPALGALG